MKQTCFFCENQCSLHDENTNVTHSLKAHWTVECAKCSRIDIENSSELIAILSTGMRIDSHTFTMWYHSFNYELTIEFGNGKGNLLKNISVAKFIEINNNMKKFIETLVLLQ